MDIKKSILFIFTLITSSYLFSQGKIQDKTPNISYVYPAGAKAGEKIELVVGGMNLNAVKDAYFSSTDIEVLDIKFFMPFKNFSNDLKSELRPIVKAIEMGEDPLESSKRYAEKQIERLREQSRKNPDNKEAENDERLKIVPGERLIYIDMTPEEVVKYIKEMSPLEYQCLCKELFTRQDMLQASPAISQKVILSLKISNNTKPGIYELRLISRNGISNPIPFEISNISEEAEDYYYHERKKKREITIKNYPLFINGEIMPGEVDYFTFFAEKGEMIRFSLKGRELHPYIGDAVPGWFQPVISILDKDNRIIAFADDYYRSPDPILDFIIQNTGDYKVSIRDSIYRGREDFVYRLKVEKMNYVSPENTRQIEIPERLKNLKNEESKASQKDNPQIIECPSLIPGVFNDSSKAHYFTANFAKGKKIVLESFAARINFPTDTFIQIFDVNGNLLAANDDYKNMNIGYITHHSDSYCILDVQNTGKYLIKIGELQNKYGADYKYLLRVDYPRPDFIVYHYPSAINAFPGRSVHVNWITAPNRKYYSTKTS